MPRFAANVSMLFGEHGFLDRFGAAAAAGFRGVETIDPYQAPAAAIRERLDAHGLTLALMNTPAGTWAAGERGMAAVPGAEARFAEHLAQALETAAVLRPGAIHVMAGLSAGEAARAAYVANLRRACAAAPDQLFTIEPINRRDMPGYHLSRTEDAVAVIEAVGAPNLRLQLDLYHAQISEGDLTTRVRALAPLTGHVQVAGVPDRAEPDAGEIDFHRMMAVLDATGYRGWVGCEYRPADGTLAGLGWFERYRAGWG